MTVNRRNLLKQLGAGVAASSLLVPRPTLADTGESLPASKTLPKHPEPIRLDRNENAYGASRKAIAALQEAAKDTSRYADSTVFLKALTDYHREVISGVSPVIKPEQIVVGCGSTDVLRTAAAAFLVPGATLIMATPTCDLLANFARSRGATVIEVPLRNDHAHNVEAMLKHSTKSRASGLF
jgi:histidinol-phosphate aminotransferase